VLHIYSDYFWNLILRFSFIQKTERQNVHRTDGNNYMYGNYIMSTKILGRSACSTHDVVPSLQQQKQSENIYVTSYYYYQPDNKLTTRKRLKNDKTTIRRS